MGQGVGLMRDIQAGPFFCPAGLTIRELKELVNLLPDANAEGEPFGVWISHGANLSSQVKAVWALNRGPDGCDILMSLDHV